MATRTPPVTRYVIELEPGVWYRDWVGTNRTIDIDAAHVYATAERATRELVRECRRRPYPFARVVPVRLSISPAGE